MSLSEEPESAEPTPRPPALRASHADRERVAELVRRAVGDGRLTLVEGDERQRAAYAATFRHELDPVVADLEPPSDTAPARTTSAAAARRDLSLPRTRPSSTTSVAVMSAGERTGTWTPGLTHRAVAFMGAVELDLREARLDESGLVLGAVAVMGGVDIDLRDSVPTAGVSIDACAVMGGVEIVVDPDTVVEVSGIGVMGSFSDDAGPPTRPDGPVLSVRGLAFWGAVSVVRKPLVEEIEGDDGPEQLTS